MKNLKTIELLDLERINGGGVLCPTLSPVPSTAPIIHYPYPYIPPNGPIISANYIKKQIGYYQNG